MGTSFQEIQDKVLNRLSSVFDPPHPKVLNGQPNPRYTAAVQTYMEALQPFQPWELEAGTKLALESHRYKKWPLPAELRNWCIQAQREGKPRPVRESKQLERPKFERPPQPERDRLAMQYRVLMDNFGDKTFTLAACKAEARRRLAQRKETANG
ncbi:hypothetical protein [Pelagibius litoralis]|uniref:hypothetical protein n=1 Tax=Pelagibius litoralis TaxID=374515 RepID=UPI001F0FB511|nr:hypothetical protein [Pelagibius litoralis]